MNYRDSNADEREAYFAEEYERELRRLERKVNEADDARESIDDMLARAQLTHLERVIKAMQ